MFGIDERALRIVWTVFLFCSLLALVYLLRDTLTLFALAIFFAYMLSPIVGLVERFLPQRRNLALTVVYFALVGLMVLVGFQLVPAIGSQASSLAARLPTLLNGDKLASIPLPRFLKPYEDQIVQSVHTYAREAQGRILSIIQQEGTKILSGLGALLPAILIPILAFFFLKDAESIRLSLLGSVERGHQRSLLRQVLDDINTVLRSYIRALVLLSLAAFVCWVGFLAIMGYQYELLLAGCAALGEFIPVIGPACALVIMLIVSIATGSGSILWLIVFWALYRMFADYVLNPILMSSGIELHPLLVLFGVLAGETLGGIMGMFFSIPVIAIIRVLYLNVERSQRQRDLLTGLPEPVVVAEPGDISSGHVEPPAAHQQS